MKDRLRKALRGAPFALLGLVALSVLVRVTVRDHVPFVATVYYGIPPVIGSFLLCAAGGAWLVQKRWRWAVGTLAGAILLGGWQVGISRFRNEPAKGELRVVMWNTQNGNAGGDRLAAAIAAFDADVVTLVEAQEAPSSLGVLDWRALPGGMLLGLRGKVQEVETVRFGKAGIVAVVRGSVRERPVVVAVVDIGADPVRPRGQAFEPLDALLARVRPDLVCGDFNTPRDSAFFDPWRRGYRHAFESAGNGMDLTWPMPLPVLSLDHVWSGPRLVPRACRHEGSGASDHRAVVAEFSWARPP